MPAGLYIVYDYDKYLLEGSTLFIMGKHLNPLEKEVLIKRYQSNPDVNVNQFCEVNNISISAFKIWLRKYSEQGIEGLISKEKGQEVTELLPSGINPSVENLKRELMKMRIENERLKKTYTVEVQPNGKSVFRVLKRKNSK